MNDFHLDPSITFLNHGSFGATPKQVLEKQHLLQKQMEERPVHFMERVLPEAMYAARETAGIFLDCDPNHLFFVRNATTGVHTILNNLCLSPNDEIVTTNHRYEAVGQAVAFHAKKWNARIVEARISFPAPSMDAILDCILRAVSHKTRVVMVDQISSLTATLFPVQELSAELQKRNIVLIVDGAHAPGQISISLQNSEFDFWTGNLHKWCCAPKGSALLYVHPKHQQNFHANVISNGYNQGIQKEFEWMGTEDFSAYLAAADAIRLHESWGGKNFRNQNFLLMKEASELLLSEIPQLRTGPPQPTLAMRSFLLEADDAECLYRNLWEKHRIEVVVQPWGNKSILRISCFSKYNQLDDYQVLCTALREELQPPSGI